MIVKIVYNDDSSVFNNNLINLLWNKYPNIIVENYNEDYYKDKKKAISVKSSCGARLTPFVSIYNDSKELIKAFYSEAKDCTMETINKYLNDFQ